MTRLFITAIGTDIGKTFVTATLIRELKEAGKTVRALKPVISGYTEGEDNDLTVLQADSLYRLRAPLSPDMAAKAEGIRLDYSAIVEFCRRPFTEDVLLIEGVGGVMVPLTDMRTTLDLMADLGYLALLVAGSYLGSLSHTLTALAALEGRNIPVQAIVVSESAGEGNPPLEGIIATLKNFTRTPIMPLPRGGVPGAALARQIGLV